MMKIKSSLIEYDNKRRKSKFKDYGVKIVIGIVCTVAGILIKTYLV